MRTITLVTLYDGSSCEHYVGAVDGMLSREQKEELCRRFDARQYTGTDDEDAREMGFVVVPLHEQSGGSVPTMELRDFFDDGSSSKDA